MTEKNPQLGKRIRKIRETKGLSQSNIERRTGIKREYLSKIENGDLDNPTLSTIRKLAQGLGVSIGKFFEADDFTKLKKAPIIKVICGASLKGRESKREIETNKYLSIPILDSAIIVKGLRYIDEETIEGYAIIPTSSLESPNDDHNRYRCMRIPLGDKRMHPIIRENSLICLDIQQRDPYKLTGSIVALRSEKGGCIISHLRISGNSIVGIPENFSEYSPIVLPINKKNPVLGKVVWYWTSLIVPLFN